LIADSEKIPKLTQKELSEKYGIGRTTVSDIEPQLAYRSIDNKYNLYTSMSVCNVYNTHRSVII
jgi:DNA-binding XRE family transcriptional regulator